MNYGLILVTFTSKVGWYYYGSQGMKLGNFAKCQSCCDKGSGKMNGLGKLCQSVMGTGVVMFFYVYFLALVSSQPYRAFWCW